MTKKGEGACAVHVHGKVFLFWSQLEAEAPYPFCCVFVRLIQDMWDHRWKCII